MTVATLLLLASLGGIALGAALVNALYATTFGTQGQEAPATASRKTGFIDPVEPQSLLVAPPAAGDADATLDSAGRWLFPPLTTLRPGTLLHGFFVQSLLGKGGQGQVYLALAPDGRQVALKGTTDPGAWASETLHLRRLSHPGIPGYVAAFLDGESYWLAQEYVPGSSPSLLLPVRDVLALGVQIARILAALHAQGIMHRDIKPGNLRLRPDGRLALLDFGAARENGWPDEPYGTPGYAAPEQRRSKSCPRSDLYALGATLWELLTGDLPDPELGAFPVLPPDCSPALEDLLRRMLAAEPKRRPPAWKVERRLARLLRGPAPVRMSLLGILAASVALVGRAARWWLKAALPGRLRRSQRPV